MVITIGICFSEFRDCNFLGWQLKTRVRRIKSIDSINKEMQLVGNKSIVILDLRNNKGYVQRMTHFSERK